jgi:CHAT domain-containing protein/Tfp pilus assembly protein PilF
LGILFFIGLSLVLVPASGKAAGITAGTTRQEDQVRTLEPDSPIERELAAGQSHVYRLSLAAGQYVRLEVDQRGIDLSVKLFGPDGRQLIEFDSEIRKQGPEVPAWVAEEAGSYRLETAAKYKNAAPGRYQIRLLERREATESDRALSAASQLLTEFGRLFRAGKYDEARPLIEQAVAIREKVLGPEHPEVAAAVANLSNLYRVKGDFAQAESTQRRAMAIWEKTLGPDHPLVGGAFNNLAILDHLRGDYAKAGPLYQRALAVREKSLGSDHLDVAGTLNNLASLYSQRGDFAQAEPLYRRALAIWEKALGPESPNVGTIIQNLANIARERGDYAQAEPLYRRALAIREKALGPEHPEVAQSLNNLAELYYYQGDYGKAEPLYRRALAIREKALGPEHPNLANSLHDLALIYRDQGDYAQAEPLFQRTLAIAEKALGPEHPDVGIFLNNFATLYRRRGDYDRAERSYRRAVAIVEKTLGPEHPRVAEFLNDLAALYAARGDTGQAVAALTRANTIAERNLALNLAAGSGRQKQAYLDLYTKETNLTLSLHGRIAPHDSSALELAFTTLLRRKGRGLDAIIDTIGGLRRHAAAADQALLDQLAEARSQLATQTLKEPGRAQPESYRSQLRPLEERVENLEAELSSRSAEFRAQTQPVTISAVQAALPAGSALVEFAVYTPLEPQTQKRQPPRYVAYLLAASGAPSWVDLGEAMLIDQAVEDWRRALRDPSRRDVKRLARIVDEKIMRPVRAVLVQMPGLTRHVLIAPDGQLNLIPFAAMVNRRNQYLIERYDLSYLTSGRDLLRLQTIAPSHNAPMVMGNPVFGRIAPTEEGASSPAQIDEGQVFFQPLPGTEEEALAIKALLPKAEVLLREQATEAALKQVRSPSLLHIATHGFFFDTQDPTMPELRGVPADTRRLIRWTSRLENPLLRSGLALAGVNQTRDGSDDGILTALEAAGLDLWGTKLVVLSACDTGVGEVKNGEGVQGLRRALVLAGSESQVISLWPVLDRTTKELMIPYYKALQQGRGRSQGLRDVQLQLLRRGKRRHPFYWAAFIQSGEWGNLEKNRR